MKIDFDAAKLVVLTAFAALVVAVPGCSENAREETREAADAVAADARAGAEKAADQTREAAGQIADKTKEAAGQVADAARQGANDAAEAGSDGWITAKVRTKFIGEAALKGSEINVDTVDHVVTLKGTVPSPAGKTRAETIARGTEGVTRVVNELVVKPGV
jgi:hyperosmotically inducible protein